MALRFEIRNLGPIRLARIEPRPLTVFVGPNNSGKSVASTILHAVMTTGSVYTSKRLVRLQLFRRPIGPLLDELASDAALAKELESFAEAALAGHIPEQSDRIDEWIVDAIGLLIRNFMVGVTSNIGDFNAADFPEFLRQGKGSARSSLTIENTDGHWSVEARFRKTDVEVHVLMPPAHLLVASILAAEGAPPERDDALLEGEPPIVVLLDKLISTMFGAFRSSHYLPAARTGIVQTAELLTEGVWQRASKGDKAERETERIPEVVTQFAADLSQMADDSFKFDDPMAKVASWTEQNLLRGRVELPVVDTGRSNPRFVAQSGESLPLTRTSSMITEVAPFVLWLRKHVIVGEQIFFEEPEAHLHPANQRLMAEAIARVVEAGTSVSVTTHSDFLVSQFNAFIKQGRLSGEAGGNGPAVAAYLFGTEAKKSGCVTRPLVVSADYGIDDEEFARVSEGLLEENLAILEAAGD